MKMKKNIFLLGLFICSIFTGFTSCNDDDDPDPLPQEKGVFVLNEGSRGKNDSGISFYNTTTGDVYFDIQEGKMGDTGQDMLLYNSRLFVAVSGSDYVLAIDPETKATLKRILLGSGKSPRYLAAGAGKVYVSTYDGYIVRIDADNLSVEKSVEIGPNPEGIAISNNILYAAITNAADYSNVDNKVAMVDLSSFTKKAETITVNRNPYYLQADASGNIYVSSMDVWSSDYSTILSPGILQRIEPANDYKVSTIVNANVLKFAINGNSCYYFTAYPQEVGVYHIDTRSSTGFITDGSKIGNVYGIDVDPLTQEVYISDTDYSNPGTVYVFSKDGKKQRSIDVGVNPNAFAFYY